MNVQKRELTFKHNLKHGRHGWLRLTPAYSIKLVHDLLDQNPNIRYVLDPFCGTGTTGLVCGERGIDCDLVEINPFLAWFAEVKVGRYEIGDLQDARLAAEQVAHRTVTTEAANLWMPPISNIDRWWRQDRLQFLAKLHSAIDECSPSSHPVRNLLLIAFCRLMIELSNAAFNHQSMSFKDEPVSLFEWQEDEMLSHRFVRLAKEIVQSAEQPIPGRVRVFHADSRQVPNTGALYNAVITSPPYPNRMSYIRELRPYMYWLGYLNEAREAGDLDWQAIGGTWGAATTRLQKWTPNGIQVCYSSFDEIIQEIAQRSSLLANYVHKYFVDISQHIASVHQRLASKGYAFYIVGNSKFYDTMVPVEHIYAEMLRHAGFVEVEVETLRKRNSKKELFEFLVKGRKQ